MNAMGDTLRQAAEQQRQQIEADTRDGVQPGSVVHVYPVSVAQRLARTGGVSPEEAAQRLQSVLSPDLGAWCFHPNAVCREWRQPESCYSVVRATCPDCGDCQEAVDAYPVLVSRPMPGPVVGRDRGDLVRAYADAAGRGVPDHRPRSWDSGRPWDDRPSPARNVLPERDPGTTRQQRLRDAADRVSRGVW
jgi:hypothetical protein